MGLLTAARPGASAAQADHGDEIAGWTEGVAVLGLNALLGGTVAAVGAGLRGGDASDAFVEGLLGGSVVWAAKHTATRDFAGAGLLGRAVGGIGASMVAASGAGLPLFEAVRIPVGPVWIRVTGEGPPVRANLPDVVTLAWAATRDELSLNVAASLSAGTAVFEAPRHTLDTGAPSVA